MYPEPKCVDPVGTCFSSEGTPHIACHECNFFIVPCMHLSRVNQRYVLDCANFGRPTFPLLLWLLILWLLTLLRVKKKKVNTGPSVFVVVAPCVVNTVPVCGSVASGMRCLLNIPQNADGHLKNGQESCTKLQRELKKALFGMCTNNPKDGGKPRDANTKADLIFKRVVFVTFCK